MNKYPNRGINTPNRWINTLIEEQIPLIDE